MDKTSGRQVQVPGNFCIECKEPVIYQKQNKAAHKRGICKDCVLAMRSGRSYLPSPEEIAEMTLEIRSNLTDRELRNRLQEGRPVGWQVPTVRYSPSTGRLPTG